MDRAEKKKTIHTHTQKCFSYILYQLSMSNRVLLFKLQLALEASSGSQLTDAEEKLSDSLTAHTESERHRKGEGIR